MSCSEWCKNLARSIIESLDSSGQVRILRHKIAVTFFVFSFEHRRFLTALIMRAWQPLIAYPWFDR
jgi:hypothetical protein